MDIYKNPKPIGFIALLLIALVISGTVGYLSTNHHKSHNLRALSSSDSQVVSGDCTSERHGSFNGATVHCNGSFRFSDKSSDGTALRAEVSGQNNLIEFRSSGKTNPTGKQSGSTVSVTQSGNGSSATISFVSTDEDSDTATKWTLRN